MTPEEESELAALKAALKQHIEEAEKATPGPWTPTNRGCSNGGVRFDFLNAGDFASSEAEMTVENAAFIASARTMSPIACRIALAAIRALEEIASENKAQGYVADLGADGDLLSILSIWKGGQP
jgi:hypothetical protein